MASPKSIYQLILIDDHAMFRKALANYIAAYDEFTVIFEAGSGKELMQYFKTGKIPDIILLDIKMPDMDGFAVAEWLKKNYPQIKVLAISSDDDGVSISKIIRSGAKGFLSKNLEPDDLYQALKSLLKGNYYLPQTHLNDMVEAMHSNKDLAATDYSFSQNEREFLKWACTDLSYKEIAEKMFVSARTVEDYRDSLYKKLNVHSRQELAIFAVKNGYAINQ
ncbi:MAG: response regulator transcription factor [Sphingobacteriia bacterium]|nr:response regulator transcription factor [Sphingobacteriia bacterium]